MYIDIFTDFMVDSDDIVGIFDLDNTTTNKFTNDFLNSLQKENKITYLVSDIPKSFILMFLEIICFLMFASYQAGDRSRCARPSAHDL